MHRLAIHGVEFDALAGAGCHHREAVGHQRPAVGDGVTRADAGAAHFLTSQQRVEHHLVGADASPLLEVLHHDPQGGGLVARR